MTRESFTVKTAQAQMHNSLVNIITYSNASWDAGLIEKANFF